MRILIVSALYWPENLAAGVYLRELAEALVTRGHRVTVLTAFPHYPEGRIHRGYRGKVFQIEVFGGVRIVRSFIWPVSRKRSVFLRPIMHVSYAISSLFAAFLVGGQDVMYVLSPSIPLGFTALTIGRAKGIPCVFGIKDLAVEGAIGTGKLRRGRVTDLLEHLERYLYRTSNYLQVASQLQMDHLIQWGIPPHRVSIIPDWADPSAIQPMPKDNDFRKRHNLRDKFVVLYSGNIGFSSDLETVIEAARELMILSDVHFVIIGDGPKRADLELRASQLSLTNVSFLPFQPREDFAEVLASADVCLMTLNRRYTKVASQGKMYNIMAAGRPLLAVMERLACGVDLILEKELGAVIEPGDWKALAKMISQWRHQPEALAACGARARRVLEERFTLEICTTHFEDLFSRLLGGKAWEFGQE